MKEERERDEAGGRRWWDGYFDDVFVEAYRPFLTEAVTREEAAAVVEALGLPHGARILDLGCGWGRHAVELAEAGYRVTGLDRSGHLIQIAAGNSPLEVGWVLGDMRELPFGSTFDAVVSLFSSLGYFLDDEEDLRVLREVRRVLRPGGLFLMETMHRDLIAREFAERDWWRAEDGSTVWVEREFDAVRGVSTETLRFRRHDGSEAEKHHSIRVRSATEWGEMLRAADFEVLEWFGSWELEPFTHRSERLLLLAASV